jgi:glycosyltransferase involved in cell wall biosynthesis
MPATAGGSVNRSSPRGAAVDVRVHFASFNTAAVTELCVRTMHRQAGLPFELVVGDCGSTDGSLELLRRFERDGWLTLEVAPGGRPHAAWLDDWFARCDRRYAVFCDSDVEFLRSGWLDRMVAAARRDDAALVATRVQARDGQPYRHPVTGAARTLAPRPEPWLMLIDVTKTRGVVQTGFGYRDEVSPAGDGKIAYDTAAAFFRALQDAGLRYVEMPPDFSRFYHHYGGMTWVRASDARLPIARRLRQRAKELRIRLALARARLLARRPQA